MAKEITITTNDTFPMPVEQSWGTYTMYLQGADGGATFAIENDGVPLAGIAVTVPFHEVVNAGQGANLDLVVTGGTGINLTLKTAKVR